MTRMRTRSSHDDDDGADEGNLPRFPPMPRPMPVPADIEGGVSLPDVPGAVRLARLMLLLLLL
jgi:hypothetical protein